jgi:hypothetical protein
MELGLCHSSGAKNLEVSPRFTKLCSRALSSVGDCDIEQCWWLWHFLVILQTSNRNDETNPSGTSPNSVCWSNATNSGSCYNFLGTEHWLYWPSGLPWGKSLGARCDVLSTGPSFGNVNLAVTADQTTLQLPDTWNSCKISRTAKSMFLSQT